MRDAVNLARRGRPAVALLTTEFIALADFVARAVGMPDIPRVILPHPVAGTGRARIADVADGAADDVLAALGVDAGEAAR